MANYKSTVFSEITTIADGIGYKLGNMVSSLVSLLAGYALAFVYCWQLSLVLAALFPIMLILGFVMSKVCVYGGGIRKLLGESFRRFSGISIRLRVIK